MTFGLGFASGGPIDSVAVPVPMRASIASGEAKVRQDDVSPALSHQVSELIDRVRAVFVDQGPLSRATKAFRQRHGQTEMAVGVARTIGRGGALVVEAGTGVGKTFAYLVPALLSGQRVLLSTATKTLQDQLFGRDLPEIITALGLPVRTALLKGRASYLCLHRLDQARTDAALPAVGSLRALAKIEQWACSTRTGDLAELPGLDERSPLIPLVTSTRENCLGSQCPQWRACHVNLARREALAADVVVINHHLFFADLSVRESGMAELLPTVQVVIFDEAHELNQTGVQFLGRQIGTGQVLDLTRDVLAAGLQHARGLADWVSVGADLERAARDLRLAAGKQWPGTKLRWAGAAPEGLSDETWPSALTALQQAAEAAALTLDTVSEIAPDFVRLHERAAQLAERAGRFAQPCVATSVRWVDVGNQIRLVESPLDIADAMRKRVLCLFDDAPPAAASPRHDAGSGPGPENRRSWIFTSATLGDESGLDWFAEPCGLTDAEQLRVESPFDYARQSALHVPRALPRPNDPGHSAAVARWLLPAVRRLGGRTLVLTTTLKALRLIGEALQAALGQQHGTNEPIDVLVQGQLPKRVLMERFRAGGTGGRPGCVLVASASFWSGFDVQGDALQLVVIDKLPFPPPNDPLVEARARRFESDGRSAFGAFFLPETAVSLRQGAGRLIRSETDRGVLAICDTRLVEMGYGRKLLAAIPPMRRLTDEADFTAAIEALVEPAPH